MKAHFSNAGVVAFGALGISLVEVWGFKPIAPCLAAAVRGVVQFPDEVREGSAHRGGFWRVPNGVLPIAAPAREQDIRATAVVVLTPAGAADAARDKPPEPVELHLQGLRVQPQVAVAAPRAAVTLRNDDKRALTVALQCSGSPPREQRLAAGAVLSLSLASEGECQVRSPELSHLTGTVLFVARASLARVDPDGAFSLDVPAGSYQARLYWQGGFVQQRALSVTEPGAELGFSLRGERPAEPAAAGP